MQIDATIPLPLYLVQYVYWKENVEPGQAISLTHATGDIPLVLGGLLTGFIKTANTDEDVAEKYMGQLRFTINPRRFNHGHIHISPDALKFFCSFLRKNLHEYLLQQILMNMKLGVTETDTIYAFMEEVGISESISFDALKKGSYRLREAKNITNFRTQKRRAG